jgi:hypothetical protein
LPHGIFAVGSEKNLDELRLSMKLIDNAFLIK